MTTATTIEQKSLEYLKNLADAIYLGRKPFITKIATLTQVKCFKAQQFTDGKTPYLDMYAVGVFDAQNQEHIIAFKNLKSIQAAITYVYTSSHTLSRQWYLVQLVGSETP